MTLPAKTNETKDPERIAPLAYLGMNLMFWGFCLAQYLAARFLVPGKILGISFFFVALALGFTLVCLFDYVCGRLWREDE